MIKFFLSLLAVCISTLVFSQMVVKTDAPYNSTQYLIEDVLLGEGVKASNFSFSGHPSQIGYFENAKSFLGLETGIVMSTGRVTDIMPPQSVTPWIGTAIGSGASDNDLLELAKLVSKTYNIAAVKKTEDAAILEFDFVPSSDSVIFRYAFASEEYNQFENTEFNDVFGFFISGPGINGLYSSPSNFPDSSINIAVIPGTNIPVSISSINNQRNSNLFSTNANEVGSFNFNGYTRILEARVKVQSCQTYHIKLAIADGSKNDYDSGVLLEARSFASAGLNLESSLGSVQNDVVLESCFPSQITLKRRGNQPYSDTIYVNVHPLSVATVSDLSTLPAYLVIPAGSDSTVLNFTVKSDSQPEGEEKLIFDFHLLSNCSDLHRYFSATLDDAEGISFIKPVMGDVNMRCYDPSVTLEGGVKGGYGQYSYSWKENGNTIPGNSASLVVSPSVSTIYEVTAVDVCSLGPISRQFVVNPPAPGFFSLDIASKVNDTIVIPCKEKPYQLIPDSIYTLNGIAKYEWSTAGAVFSTIESPVINATESAYYYLALQDSCGQELVDSVYITFANAQPLSLNTVSDTAICMGNPVMLAANAGGGSGLLTYNWSSLGSKASSVTVLPTTSTRYGVTVTDACGTSVTKTIFIKVHEVIADFEYSYDETDFGVVIKNYSKGEQLKYAWSMDRRDLSEVAEPRINLDDVENHNLELIVTDVEGCGDTAHKVLLPQMFTYIPNIFTPNGDGYNDEFKVSIVDPVQFEMTVFDRWGTPIFKSNDPSKGWNGAVTPTGEVVPGTYAVHVTAFRSNDVRIDKHATIRVEP